MKKLLGLISFLLVLAGSVSAKVVLPAIFSDNMVLQQNAQVNLWGKATPGERVSVKASWTDKTVTTKAAADGKWTVKLKTPAAAKGQSVTVSGENTITINNVLVGEVWLCTGQSNMEYPVSRHPDKKWMTGMTTEAEEMKDADYPELRLFRVEHQLAPDGEKDDCQGRWLVCTPKNLYDFSAVGFVFGRRLHKELNVPVGMIQSTWEQGSYARWFADSEMMRFPQAYRLDHGKRLFFGYAQGVGCCAMLQMWKTTGERRYYDYVKQWADSLINEKGEIHLYDKSTYNLDFINSGKVLFDLYRETGDQRYKAAMDILIKQLKNQPRTLEGGFWHKLIYQHQMWLDGLYMASPFMAQYGAEFNKPEWIDEAVKQFRLCHKHTYDAKTGLYHHAWDESKSQRWANPETGHSPNFWGRSIGWWFMALVDALDYIPENHPGRADMIGYIRGLAETLPKYQDKAGLWYQVIDQPKRKGNFPEASVTTQCMYAYAKAVNKGYIDARYRAVAEKALQGLKDKLLVEKQDGTLTLTRCCQVGGLGGHPYRDGSFEYYIGEKMRDNDAKATGPFIMGCLELEKIK